MNKTKTVIIVGGVAAGASCATRLRRLDEHCNIIMVDKGSVVSFANCGLPYHVSGVIKNRSSLNVQSVNDFKDKFNIDVRVNTEAIEIDKDNKVVIFKNCLTNEITKERYDDLVLTMGAEPIRPPFHGSQLPNVFTLRTLEDMDKIIASKKGANNALVVGGGFIGIEMAENLRHCGIDVTLVEMANQVMAPIDYELAQGVERYLMQNGIDVITGKSLQKIQEGNNCLIATIDSNDIPFDFIVLAIGVTPDSSLAKTANLALNDRGAIIVNDHMQTSVDHIYAAGDVIEITDRTLKTKGYVPLAGPANKQGRIVADNLCNIPSTYIGTQGASIIKIFDMTVASVGVNEKTAKRHNIPYDKIFLNPYNHATYYPDASQMAMKILFDPTNGRILGGQAIGFSGVDKRIDTLSVAISATMTAFDLTQLEFCYAPPFGSAKDPINFAGYVIDNLLTDKIKQVHWLDIQQLQMNVDYFPLDVRLASEVHAVSVPGFINISLQTLRQNLHKLPKDKPIFVNCKVGIRAYNAARILLQEGFDARIIAGGTHTYSLIFDKKILKR